jgi:hypothetical protein
VPVPEWCGSRNYGTEAEFFVPLDQVVEGVAELVGEAYELFGSRTDGVLKVLLLP